MDTGVVSERTSHRAFVGVSALLFATSAALTIAWCGPMSAMGGMPMPGGWTMSMAWMRMPGQTWPDAAASFLVMWVVMMVAMMLPSLAPMLWRYRRSRRQDRRNAPGPVDRAGGRGVLLGVDGVRNGRFSGGRCAGGGRDAAAGAGGRRSDGGGGGGRYWLARSSSPRGRHITLPAAGRRRGAAVRCRPTPPRPGATACASASTAAYGCAGLTAILLVIGIMDLRAMAVVTAAITAERSHRPVSAWREPSGPLPSGQGCF